MSIETNKFYLSNLNWLYKSSGEVMTNGQAANLIKTGIKSINIECKSCERNWSSSGSNDKSFSLFAGGARIACTCGSEESIQSTILNKAG
jgi:hypothetical protein